MNKEKISNILKIIIIIEFLFVILLLIINIDRTTIKQKKLEERIRRIEILGDYYD